MAKLNVENYQKGVLLDEELMGGVSEAPDNRGFAAFVVHLASGEHLGYQEYPTKELAISAINQIPRDWSFSGSSLCSGCATGDCSRCEAPRLN